jgi:hypothetical protein
VTVASFRQPDSTGCAAPLPDQGQRYIVYLANRTLPENDGVYEISDFPTPVSDAALKEARAFSCGTSNCGMFSGGAIVQC